VTMHYDSKKNLSWKPYLGRTNKLRARRRSLQKGFSRGVWGKSTARKETKE
jgi:hypothetical protein